MSFVYNQKYYDGTTLKQLSPKLNAFKTIALPDGIIIGLFQGNRGQFPRLDFKIKILKPGKKAVAEPPPHIYWIVDLIIKKEKYSKEIIEIIKYYNKFYNNCKPFSSKKARNSYNLKTVNFIKEKFKKVAHAGSLSVEYISTILELFCLCEKRNKNAHMFKDLLLNTLKYMRGNIDYMELLKSAKAGFR